MFKKESIIQLLEKIGSTLSVKVRVYMIGGGALSLKGLKEATKDIDLVLSDRKALYPIKKCFEKIGYKIDKGLFKEQVYKDAVFVFFDKSDSRIDIIVEMIDDIASRVNVLALNAAVEATRAGDFGKGFMVVANEIRKLAKNTATATQEVTQLVGTVQNSIH